MVDCTYQVTCRRNCHRPRYQVIMIGVSLGLLSRISPSLLHFSNRASLTHFCSRSLFEGRPDPYLLTLRSKQSQSHIPEGLSTPYQPNINHSLQDPPQELRGNMVHMVHMAHMAHIAARKAPSPIAVVLLSKASPSLPKLTEYNQLNTQFLCRNSAWQAKPDFHYLKPRLASSILRIHRQNFGGATIHHRN